MAQNKIFEFNYTLKKTSVIDGKEVTTTEKKTADAEAMQFESVADILAFYEGKEAGAGERLLIEEINSSFKSTAIANKRAELTRIPTVPKNIANKAKEQLDATELLNLKATLLKLGLNVDALS